MPAVQIELANLVQTQTTALSDAWAGTSWVELYAALGDVVSTLIVGTSMSLFIFLCLVVIYAVTYAQVIWAQMALMILTFVGPMMIPWLVQSRAREDRAYRRGVQLDFIRPGKPVKTLTSNRVPAGCVMNA